MRVPGPGAAASPARQPGASDFRLAEIIVHAHVGTSKRADSALNEQDSASSAEPAAAARQLRRNRAPAKPARSDFGRSVLAETTEAGSLRRGRASQLAEEQFARLAFQTFAKKGYPSIASGNPRRALLDGERDAVAPRSPKDVDARSTPVPAAPAREPSRKNDFKFSSGEDLSIRSSWMSSSPD